MPNAYLSVEPWGDRVMVKRDKAPEAIGSIVLADRYRPRPARGTVLAVGRGRLNQDGSYEPVGCQAGDTVAFLDHAGEEFKLNGNRVLLMSEADVLAVLESE
jgi:chaperonin GroES